MPAGPRICPGGRATYKSAMVEEVAYLWAAAQIVSTTGGDSRGAHHLAAAGSIGKRRGAGSAAHPESADYDEYTIGQCHQRRQRSNRNEHRAGDLAWPTGSAGVGENARLTHPGQ